jgi:long-chain acyl-CoA synthetase
MAIFDITTGKELPYNQEGEICMTGPNTMIGYYNNEAETNNVIKQHDDGLMWVHSGDIGYIDGDGFVFIKDRIKRVIIRHDGFKVFPSLIEKAVDTNDNVVSNCAVGVADTSHSQGKLPIVFAVLKDGSDADTVKKKLFELCQKELPEYVQPVDFIIIDKMPLTPIGKVDYRALEKEAESL